MTDQDMQLLQRFNVAVKNGLSEDEAISFLAALTIADYEQLIKIFKEVDDKNMPEEAREKIIMVFTAIRDEAMKDISRT